MNFIDLMLIVFMAWGAIKGFKRGIIQTLGGLCGWLVSLLAAIFYSSQLKIFLDEKMFFSPRIAEWIEGNLPLPSFMQNTSGNINEIQLAINNLHLPEFMKDILGEKIILLNATGSGTSSMTEIVALSLADMIAKGAAFLVLFLMVSFIIKLLLALFSRGVNATIFGGVNRLAGLFTGIMLNACIVAVIIGAIYPVLSAILPASSLVRELQSSSLTPILLNIFAVISHQVFGFI